MEHGVKQFARRILAIHLALLLILLAVVYAAAGQIYHSARVQALQQARERQALLATQTSRTIENFYEGIFGVLELYKPPAEDSGDPDPATKPATDSLASTDAELTRGGIRAQFQQPPQVPPRRGRGPQPPATTRPNGGRGLYAGQRLVQQLQGRSHLFWVERFRGNLHAYTYGAEIGPVPPAPTPFEAEVLEKMGDWLKGVKEPTISGYFKLSTDAQGFNLVAAPQVRGRTNSRLLIAATGTRPIERDFFDDLSQQGSVEAYLFDDTTTAMVGTHPGFLGQQLDRAADPQLHKAVESLKPSYRGTCELNGAFTLGSQTFAPAMITVEPIRVLDKQWLLMITSPLAEVDAVVKELFRKAVFWAAFVAVSMAGILVSTATQLIRSRMRTERVRHELLQGELRQARQIQLAWLPDKTKQAARGLDIASMNRPANHISGDFYNFFDLPDGRTAVVIGDVTGHGISAAFLMATTQLLVRVTLPRVMDPGQCLEEVNRQLCMQVFNGQFVTMQILVIDSRTGVTEIGTAGHPPPLISGPGEFKPLPLEPQLVLGVDPTATYPTQRFTLQPGASLLLYTDGVVEAEDPDGNRLRLDGLRKPLRARFTSANALLDTVVAAVHSFRKNRELKDDLTIVAVQRQLKDSEKPQPIAAASA